MNTKELKEALEKMLLNRKGYVAIVRVYKEKDGELLEVENPDKPYLCKVGNRDFERVNAEHIQRALKFFTTEKECKEAVGKYIARLNRWGIGKPLTEGDVLVDIVKVCFTMNLAVK